MVYGELGRYPLKIDIKVRMISYWCKLIQGKQSKFSTIVYKLLYVDVIKVYKIINTCNIMFVGIP
jgi:hypothetical protein